MTEYEMADLAMSQQANYWQLFQVAQGHAERVYAFFEQFGTILFGYLIVSYFIGAKLSRVQVCLLTALYLFWLVRLGVALNMTLGASQVTLGELRKISPDLYTGQSIPSQWGIYALLILLVAGSFYFMWTVRHPKTE